MLAQIDVESAEAVHHPPEHPAPAQEVGAPVYSLYQLAQRSSSSTAPCGSRPFSTLVRVWLMCAVLNAAPLASLERFLSALLRHPVMPHWLSTCVSRPSSQMAPKKKSFFTRRKGTQAQHAAPRDGRKSRPAGRAPRESRDSSASSNMSQQKLSDALASQKARRASAIQLSRGASGPSIGDKGGKGGCSSSARNARS